MNYKEFEFWDISLIKLSVLCAALFLVSVWPGFATWVTNTHWLWFLIASLVFAIKPTMKVFKK